MTEWFDVRIRSGFDPERHAITQTVFHGINKSGSLAAAKVLHDAFVKAERESEIFSHYHRRDLSLPQLLQLMQTAPAPTFFAGHDLFQAVEPRPGRIYITQLRHPVARIVSVFHWMMHNSKAVRSGVRKLPPETTLRDFVKASTGKGIGASKQIALGFGQHRETLTKSLSPREIRYLAMNSLDSGVYLYGIAEHFEESLFLYAHLLGLPRLTRWRRDIRNKGRPDLSEIPQVDMDAIYEVFEEEILFYGWALERFFAKIASVDFGPELEQYKKACGAEYSNRIFAEWSSQASERSGRGGSGPLERTRQTPYPSRRSVALDAVLRTSTTAEELASDGVRQTDALVVLGMHRSGTSAVTGTLSLCGAWVGERDELTGAGRENEKGFFERRDLRNICDGLLFAADADWWKISSFSTEAVPKEAVEERRAAFAELLRSLDRHGSWAIKEPRLCLLFPLLRPAIRNPVCIHATRNPLEVARSLQARNGFSLMQGLALWEVYTRSALAVSAGLPRVFVAFESLVSAPLEQTTRLVRQLEALGVRGLRLPEPEVLTNFISPDLRRQRSSQSESLNFLEPPQRELWERISAGEDLPEGGMSDVSPRSLQHLRDLEAQHERVLSLEGQRASLLTERKELKARLAVERDVNAARRPEGEAALIPKLAAAEEARAKAQTAVQAEAAARCQLAEELAVLRRKSERPGWLLKRLWRVLRSSTRYP